MEEKLLYEGNVSSLDKICHILYHQNSGPKQEIFKTGDFKYVVEYVQVNYRNKGIYLDIIPNECKKPEIVHEIRRNFHTLKGIINGWSIR